jgi:choline-phosphate cytidylyltransferase
LKKNELDVKRTMAELRDSIKANWTTTGQELSKDFRQFWQSSRPASPARTPTREQSQSEAMEAANIARSPSAISRLSHLDIPRANNTRESSEFAAGYNLGLIGGVRSWVRYMMKTTNKKHATNPRSFLDGTQPPQPKRQPPSIPHGRQLRRTRNQESPAAGSASWPYGQTDKERGYGYCGVGCCEQVFVLDRSLFHAQTVVGVDGSKR